MPPARHSMVHAYPIQTMPGRRKREVSGTMLTPRGLRNLPQNRHPVRASFGQEASLSLSWSKGRSEMLVEDSARRYEAAENPVNDHDHGCSPRACSIAWGSETELAATMLRCMGAPVNARPRLASTDDLLCHLTKKLECKPVLTPVIKPLKLTTGRINTSTGGNVMRAHVLPERCSAGSEWMMPSLRLSVG